MLCAPEAFQPCRWKMGFCKAIIKTLIRSHLILVLKQTDREMQQPWQEPRRGNRNPQERNYNVKSTVIYISSRKNFQNGHAQNTFEMFPVPQTPADSIFSLRQIVSVENQRVFISFLYTYNSMEILLSTVCLVLNSSCVYICWNGAMFVWVGAADVAPLSEGKSYKITDVAVFFLPPPCLISVVFEAHMLMLPVWQCWYIISNAHCPRMDGDVPLHLGPVMQIRLHTITSHLPLQLAHMTFLLDWATS